ncbi:MAG: methylaspartate mutase [Actinobacteria bacterium]|nr:methylaspartate mutase [Actinomycetota bacterium]
MTGPERAGSFGRFVTDARLAGELVVQPRMGMADPQRMRSGLAATRAAAATTVGTITLDSYTRVADWPAAAEALRTGAPLNGYPIVTHELATTRAVLAGIADDAAFPVQVRHGSAQPEAIFEALVAAGLSATEGGPVSYCLPYGRVPLHAAVDSWKRCCAILAAVADTGVQPHLETFGGCLMGQLCPPSLLVAVAVLEALFFAQHGLTSVSLSYAQQASHAQDVEAVRALHRLAGELLPGLDTHVVIYAYMGVYPRTVLGAERLLVRAARLAAGTGAARLIVKTAAEAHRIPTVAENVRALELASVTARATGPEPFTDGGTEVCGEIQSEVYGEARALIEAVLELDDDLGRALLKAFRSGYLDVPFCLHPDNAGRSRSRLAPDGRLSWSRVGSMPLPPPRSRPEPRELTAAELLRCLSHVERTCDEASLEESLAAV